MPYNPYQFQIGDVITSGSINSLRVTDIIPGPSTAGKYLSTDGTNLTWLTVAAATPTNGLFYKEKAREVAFFRTGNSTAGIKAGTIIDVSGTVVTFSASAAITMPTLAAGTDYAIWVKSDGTIQASSNHTAAPGAGAWRKIGGFHYAPGGNATAQAGGDTTPQINEYSFWDLKFRPACPDPRGMTLVANSFWSDIYLTCQNAATLGLTSVYNVTIADGASPPIVPTMFGGNGTTNYGSYTWLEAQELASAFGKRCPNQPEFMALAYGTTENSSRGGDPVSTTMLSFDAPYTSKWGAIQVAGCMYTYSNMRSGPWAASSWVNTTENRGQEYAAPNIGVFGAHWANQTNPGSRCSAWSSLVNASYDFFGSRFVCDHLAFE